MIFQPALIAPALLAWYDTHRRRLPWRSAPGDAADPYRVWLSEIMLQQTVVATVIPYFERFVARWPTVKALAAASLDDVLTEWAGLGYYARARNLHACARAVVERYDSRFPNSVDALLTLPGIGAYTAGAIAAIAFDRPALAMDGNVERVTARLAAVEAPLPAARPRLRAIAETMVPARRAGDFAQALMDLGATICVPATPRCLACPIRVSCLAFSAGDPGRLPLKTAKVAKPTRNGRVYWIVDAEGSVLLRRREERGLLGGMMEFPSSSWASSLPAGHDEAPLAAEWRELPGTIRHVFTHFNLELHAATVTLNQRPLLPGLWLTPDRFGDVALPSIMRKVVAHVSRQTVGVGATEDYVIGR